MSRDFRVCRSILVIGSTLVLALAAAAGAAGRPLDWRFGIEDTLNQLDSMANVEGDPDLLADRLAPLTASQGAGGDVNLNQVAGGWGTMQPHQEDAIDFTASDEIVQRLQSRRFSLLWNFALNAIWATSENADCYAEPLPLSSPPILDADCAPDIAHEQDLSAYVHALVERYDGDGLDDMPGLTQPIRFYAMTGEIDFPGANDNSPVHGDDAPSPFWRDSLAHLLAAHRIVYQAIHDADPTGKTNLVSSGGVFWDLYADFPDYPALEGPTVTARLAGDNNYGAPYSAGYQTLIDLLEGLTDETDGPKCDYIGWHPHMGWREIPQTFAFIHAHAPGKPIYVDDMWTNLFTDESSVTPGYAQFTDGGAAIAGDFPNVLLPDYDGIRLDLLFNPFARAWYQGRTARQLVKSYATAFGEGAERVGFSGDVDTNLDRAFLFSGWLNLLGAFGDSAVHPYPEEPAFWTYRLLVEKLHDFACVAEIPVSSDPRTRVYRFERPRGPVWVGWSETGGPPPGLDYDAANGESVGFDVGQTSLLRTGIVDQVGQTEPPTALLATPTRTLTVQLGYRPLIVEWPDVIFADGFECGGACLWSSSSPDLCPP